MCIHIIYTSTKVFLSKKLYESWREIQDEYADYTTSLGPWGAEEIAYFLQQEYPDLLPPAKTQIDALLASAELVHEVTFCE